MIPTSRYLALDQKKKDLIDEAIVKVGENAHIVHQVLSKDLIEIDVELIKEHIRLEYDDV